MVSFAIEVADCSRFKRHDGRRHGVETDGPSVVVKLESPHRLVIGQVTPAFVWLKPHNLIYIIINNL